MGANEGGKKIGSLWVSGGGKAEGKFESWSEIIYQTASLRAGGGSVTTVKRQRVQKHTPTKADGQVVTGNLTRGN